MLPLATLGSATPTLRGSQSQAISKGGRCVLRSRASSVLSDRSQDTFQHSSGAPGEQKTAQTTAALFRKDLKLLDYKQEKKVVCFRLPSGLGCSSAVWQQALKTATIPPFQATAVCKWKKKTTFNNNNIINKEKPESSQRLWVFGERNSE